jgi:ribosomal protein L37AE/L43A
LKTELPDIKEVMKAVKEYKVTVKLCPRCLQKYFTPYGETYIENVSPSFPALSRRDNKTHICTSCGQQEAVEDMFKNVPRWEEHRYWEDS